MKEAESQCVKLQADALTEYYKNKMGFQGPGVAGETNSVFDEACQVDECEFGCEVTVTLDENGKIAGVTKHPIERCFLRK
jgi:hypothetical protein